MDWAEYYPAYVASEAETQEPGHLRNLSKNVTVADIGCGFGGLLVALAPVLPDDLLLGISNHLLDYTIDTDTANPLRPRNTPPSRNLRPRPHLRPPRPEPSP